jgi:hypothetical protein
MQDAGCIAAALDAAAEAGSEADERRIIWRRPVLWK